MKKLFFLRGLTVAITTVVFYAAFILACYSIGPHTFNSWIPNALSTSGGQGYTLLRLNEAEKASDVDILFVGSSQVNRGFDVRIFEKNGLKAFNLGTSAQTLFNSYYLLKEYLPTSKPKHVVLDLYWGVAKNDGVEPSIDILSNSDFDESTLEMVLDLKNGTVFGSLAANAILRLRTPIYQVKQKEFRDSEYISGGFTKSLATNNKLDAEDLQKMKPLEANMNDFQLEYLKKIIALCKSSNTKLIFVLTPVTKEYKRKVTNYNSYTNKIARIAKENKIPFLDYNQREELSLVSSEDFSDRNHLAQSGAEKFDSLFIKDLGKLGVSQLSLSRK
ncbi:DUF1574 family protein [Pontibacter liquoris]|uniref:DUF1574 family protein n=1 Tax=Pontibacter liquoris TaxID=2905677 RepID=UPI001FA73CE3|nr:DUF1574 family protein [Pontibacter liquoris]